MEKEAICIQWLSGLTSNHNHIIKPLNVKYTHTPVMEKLYVVNVADYAITIFHYTFCVSTLLIPFSNPGNLKCTSAKHVHSKKMIEIVNYIML